MTFKHPVFPKGPPMVDGNDVAIRGRFEAQYGSSSTAESHGCLQSAGELSELEY